MVADPFAIAFTTPTPETLATAVSLDDQVAAGALGIAPLAECATAVACVVSPGLSDDDAKATETVLIAEELLPLLAVVPLVAGPARVWLSWQAARAATARMAEKRKRMRSLLVGRSHGGSTGMTRGERAVASELCVAGFHRVCLDARHSRGAHGRRDWNTGTQRRERMSRRRFVNRSNYGTKRARDCAKFAPRRTRAISEV
jgi:hypothetical protein